MPSAGPFLIANTAVTLESSDARFADSARWCFRDLALQDHAPTTESHHFLVTRFERPYVHYEMQRDGEICQHSLDEGYVLFHLQWEFNRLVLEHRALTIHAAGVVIDDRAVILCGASGSGKTTLAGYLSWRGAQYLADEVIALDDHHRALPYPRPLGLRHGGPLESHLDLSDDPATVFQRYERVVPVTSLGKVTVSSTSAEVGALVFPRYSPGASITTTPLLPSDAFERLTTNLPGLARFGSTVFFGAAELVRRLPCIALEYSDLEAAAEVVRETLVARTAR